MGFYVTASISTEYKGDFDKFYVRIEDYRILKPFGQVRATINHYKNHQMAAKAIPEYVEDLQSNNASGMLDLTHTYNSESIKHDINLFFPLTVEEDVTVTTYSSSWVDLEVEYTDFDDDGNEITKIRTQSVERVTTGSKVIQKNKVNLDLITGSIYPYVYERVKDHYSSSYGYTDISNH